MGPMVPRFSSLPALIALSAFLALPVTAIAQEVRQLEAIPGDLPQAERESFQKERTELVRQSAAVAEQIGAFNARCGSVRPDDKALIARCTQDQTQLGTQQKGVLAQADGFRTRVRTASLRLATSEIARALMSAAAHGAAARTWAAGIEPGHAATRNLDTPMERAKNQASKVFDTPGSHAGSLAVDASRVDAGEPRDPVVPATKRTAAVTELETTRDTIRRSRQKVTERLNSLYEAYDKAKDGPAQLAIVEAKQKASEARHLEGFLSFKIEQVILAPARE